MLLADDVNAIGTAIADPTRLSILMAALRAPESSVGEIVRSVGYATSTVVNHITKLEQAGLVERRARGRRTIILARVDRWRMLTKACEACADPSWRAR
jgi:DNA-binding transcriptional ArsR family regulator